MTSTTVVPFRVGIKDLEDILDSIVYLADGTSKDLLKKKYSDLIDECYDVLVKLEDELSYRDDDDDDDDNDDDNLPITAHIKTDEPLVLLSPKEQHFEEQYAQDLIAPPKDEWDDDNYLESMLENHYQYQADIARGK